MLTQEGLLAPARSDALREIIDPFAFWASFYSVKRALWVPDREPMTTGGILAFRSWCIRDLNNFRRRC